MTLTEDQIRTNDSGVTSTEDEIRTDDTPIENIINVRGFKSPQQDIPSVITDATAFIECERLDSDEPLTTHGSSKDNYTELVCDNLGPLRDSCDCDKTSCFVCRRRALFDDDRIAEDESTAWAIWANEDHFSVEGKEIRTQDLIDGDSVKPCCFCF